MSHNAIILAAGKGTRMNSDLPKVAHEIVGKTMIDYVIDAVNDAKISNKYIVVGHQAEYIKSITSYPNVTHVLQAQQLGTGHAVMQAESAMVLDDNLTLILAGDCPLIKSETIKSLIEFHQEQQAVCTVLTTEMTDPARYGRIIRNENGEFTAITEAKDCTDEQLLVKEINSGIFVFNTRLLFEALKKITTNNAQNEYYLTDVCHILRESGQHVSAYCIEDSNQVIGINSQEELAEVSKLILQRG